MTRTLAITLIAGLAVPAFADHDSLIEVGFEESGWLRTSGDAPPPDGLLVDLADGLDEEEITQLGQELGLVFEDHADVVAGNRYEIHGLDLEEAKRILEGRDEIESVEWNVQYSLFDVPSSLDDEEDPEQSKPGTKPNDPMYKSQWHFNMVNAEAAWTITQNNDIIVAIIDT